MAIRIPVDDIPAWAAKYDYPLEPSIEALVEPVRQAGELRIGAPMLIHGVGWPVSSVILHWFHREPYPLLDFRALWSVGMEDDVYSMPFWLRYVESTRELAAKAGVSMRELDRALWQFSKETQR